MTDTQDAHERITQPLPLRPGAADEMPPTESLPFEREAAWQETKEVRGRPFRPATNYQDEVLTPPPTAAPLSTRPAARQFGPSRALVAVVALSFILSLASLALNVYLISSLFEAQKTAVEGLDAAIAAVDDFGGKGFHYDYRFQREIPIVADVPFKQEMNFPFEGNFPIKTTVTVPINAGVLGTFNVEVPIDTSVYVKTSVPVKVDETFHIETSVPVDLTIPIDVRADDPEIQRLLSQVRGWLVRLRSIFR